jgi:hypothetical protein
MNNLLAKRMGEKELEKVKTRPRDGKEQLHN